MALNKTEFMTTKELAEEFGISQLKVQNMLKKDHAREVPKYPFAIAEPPDEKSVKWTYRIFRERYNRWKCGELGIDLERFADIVAKRAAEKMGA